MPGSYDQYCPIARSLDVLGDRWTLLVLRELSLGRQRFTDLRGRLPGIPPNVLSQRLKRLTDQGFVTVEQLPPPAARNVYTLTPRGRDVVPVLRALVRFGTPELEPATPEKTIRDDAIGPVLFRAWFDEAAAATLDVDEHYEVVADGQVHRLWSRRAVGGQGRADRPPALLIEGPAWALVRLRQGSTLDELVADGLVTVTGSKAARTRFQRLYALLPEAGGRVSVRG